MVRRTSILFVLVGRCLVSAQEQAGQFNQVLNLNGDMQANVIKFPDNTKVETFSQTQRQLLVNQNSQPLSAEHVTGSTGQPFVALSQNSVTMQTNGAIDLVGAQIELPIDPQALKGQQLNADNTFVAQLSPDRQSWMIMEGARSVNTTDNTVRIVKRNNIDGEFMALGRKTVETNNVLTPFGSDAQSSVNITGSGLQEMEFVDGFRMSVQASQPMTVTADVVNGISSGMLPQGQQSVNNFRYLVTTNLGAVSSGLNQMVSVVQLPINAAKLQQMAQQMGVQSNGQIQLAIAQRGVLQNPGGATGQLSPPPASQPARRRRRRQDDGLNNNNALNGTGTQNQGSQGQAAANPAATQLLLAPQFAQVNNTAVLDQLNGRIAVPVTALDGEFIITMQQAGGATQPPQGQTSAAPQAQGQGQAQPALGQAPGQSSSSTSPISTGQNSSNVTVPLSASASASASVAPMKRQATAQPGVIIMSMQQIEAMVQAGQNGGYIPVGQMMKEVMTGQGVRKRGNHAR